MAFVTFDLSKNQMSNVSEEEIFLLFARIKRDEKNTFKLKYYDEKEFKLLKVKS